MIPRIIKILYENIKNTNNNQVFILILYTGLANIIKANDFSGTTDAYGNINVPKNIVKPSTGHILSADIDSGFCLVGTATQGDGYFIRCLNSDPTLTNRTNSDVIIYIRYCV